MSSNISIISGDVRHNSVVHQQLQHRRRCSRSWGTCWRVVEVQGSVWHLGTSVTSELRLRYWIWTCDRLNATMSTSKPNCFYFTQTTEQKHDLSYRRETARRSLMFISVNVHSLVGALQILEKVEILVMEMMMMMMMMMMTYKVCAAIALNVRIQSFLIHICLPQLDDEMDDHGFLRHGPTSVVSGRTTGAVYCQHTTLM